MVKALIFGCTGQDGSYLAEFLLKKGYEVWGMYRRSSSDPLTKINHIKHKLNLRFGDLTDSYSIKEILKECKPDEIYNLASQSDVGVSFKCPQYTEEANYYGVGRIVNAIKDLKLKSKLYQASTSECFGNLPVKVINEKCLQKNLFNPQSPYADAKLKAHIDFIKGYREKYGMFLCSGFMFNHETMAEFMPIFVREEDGIDIKPLSDVLTFVDKSKKEYQAQPIRKLEVLGKNGWTKVKYASAYPHNIKGDNKNPKFISARCGAYLATGSHVVFMDGEEKKTSNIKVGDKFEIIILNSKKEKIIKLSQKEAELIGMLVADGYISKKRFDGKFTKNDKEILKRFKELWKNIVGTNLTQQQTPSGFKRGNTVTQIKFPKSKFTEKLDIYTSDRKKRIPKRILNADKEAQMFFLRGYNSCDGLKQDKCTYEFKAFKTNSATLAQGLWYLTDVLLPNQRKTFYTFNSKIGSIIYCINFNSPKSAKSHLSREFEEVTKVIDCPNYNGWFYDLETESEEFISGIGNIHVHNSPRRGEHFVTRKITISMCKILLGLQDKFSLGNLDAKRDWGFAPDYVEAMWLMLQQKKPQDYIIATGETHSVREFINATAKLLKMKIKWKGKGINEKCYWNRKIIIDVDPKFYRPKDVHHLKGDPQKIKKELKWELKVKFEDLVAIMAMTDLQLLVEHEKL